MRAAFLASLAAVGLSLSAACGAEQFVTVRPQPSGDAWWLRADFNALNTSVRGIPVARIRPDWCKATEFTRDAFPPELLVENGQDVLAESKLSFSVEGAFDGSKIKQTALVGVYKTCRGQKGRFVLILDSDSRKVRFVDARPAKDRFSALATDGRSVTVVYCLECDITATVRWDRARARFIMR